MSNVIYLNITYDNDVVTYRVKEVSSANEANAISATDLSHTRDAGPPSHYNNFGDTEVGEYPIQNVLCSYRVDKSTYSIVVSITYENSNGGTYQIGPFYGDLKDGLIVEYEGKDSIKFYLRNGNELWISVSGKNGKMLSF